MRLRIPELLKEHNMTAYALAKASEGRITQSMAYRLSSGHFGMVSNTTLEALCDVFGITDPGPLFTRDHRPTSKRK